MADAVKRETGANVQLVDGARSELTVLVDGQAVSRKGDSFPSEQEVVAEVKKAMQSGSPA